MGEADENVIRQYLLGALAEAEMARFDERLMTEDELFEMLLVVEDELIDERAGDHLSPDERTRFDSYFLSTPARRERLDLARALRDYAQRVAQTQGDENPGSAPEATPDTTQPPDAPDPVAKDLAPPSAVIRPPRWSSSRAYLGLAAAAILVIAAASTVWLTFFRQSEVSKGLQALNQAYREQRPLEARITGFEYAPATVTRGAKVDAADPVALNRAERILLDEVADHPGAASYHALGKLYLAEQKLDDAITQFEKGLSAEPGNAQLHSDLGAAYMERGGADSSSGQSLNDLARGLEHLTRALEMNDGLLEARFNRALVYQRLMLPQQAEQDWREYLKKDQTSRWADEARRHLTQLEEQKAKRSQSRNESLREFTEAYADNDVERAWAAFSRSRETATGRLLTEQLLEAYLAQSANGAADAQASLHALAFAGGLEQQKTGDHYTADLARYYQSTSPARRAKLVQAHLLMQQGRQSYTQSDYGAALLRYRDARAIFDQQASVSDSLLAGLRIAQCQLQSAAVQQCLTSLPGLIAVCEAARYEWLLSQFLIMTARALAATREDSKAMAYIRRALPISERISDNYSHQKSLAFLALENKEMGDLPAALDDLWRCLLAMDASWAGARQSWRNYDTAGQIFIACESFTAATAFEKEALGLAVNEVDDPSFTYVSYTNLGLAYGKMQRVAEAITYAQLGYDIGRSFLPERSGKQMMAYSNLQLGYLYRQSGNYVQALAHYDDSLALCRDLDFPAYAYDAHKGRLSCHLAQHEDRAADEELRTTLGLFEQQRSRIRDESNRTTFFDSQQSVYDLAIDFEVSRMNNERRAFEYSEISRARSLVDMTGAGVTPVAAAADRASPPGSSPLSLEQIQRALPEQAQLLQYAVLEDKLLIWLVTNGEIRLETKEIGAAALSEKIVRYWQVAANVSERAQAEADQLAGELYTTLIAPFETRLDRQKQLCIVPDKALVYLPFGALRSPASRAYLASDYLIVYAPSATLFLHCTAVARQRDLRRPEYALSVGNPAFDRDLFRALPDLPASANEAEAIRRIYESGCVLIGERATEDRVKAEMMKADVINLASHYIVNQASPPRSGLLLTKGLASAGGEPGADGVLRAGEVYAMKLRQARLVVLAACRTGVEGYYKGEGMIGMSRAFIIAGVPLIVASLWPVDSEATALLIEKLHTYRKRAGLSTAAALQQAQRDFINGADARRQQPYYWASFVLIGGFAKI